MGSAALSGRRKNKLNYLIVYVATFFVLCQQGIAIAQSLEDDIKSGQLRFYSSSGQFDTALLKETKIAVTVTGMQGRVTLTQRFENTSNEWLEGEYLFPLPPDSAVDHMVMTIGERRIVGKIREKEEAKKIYQEAKQAGKKASLISQHRPNLFRSRVANIAPGEIIEVELKYLQTLHYDQGQFSMRFPTTLTPRYIPGRLLSHVNNPNDASIENKAIAKLYDQDETPKTEAQLNKTSQFNQNNGWTFNSNERLTDQVPDADLISSPMVKADAAASLHFSALLDAGISLEHIESLYHPITISENNGRYQIELTQAEKLNKDLVLRWTPETGKAPRAALFAQKGSQSQTFGSQNNVVENFVLFMLLPPQQFEQNDILPKETIFVIDTSGSMAGNSITQAKRALLQGLRQLNPQDRFNIIEFNSNARALWSQARIADNANFYEGEQFINRLNANGGTEMASALHLALANDAPQGFIRQVIFITDGSVGNEEALFSLIEKTKRQSRIFTVGIGSAPNRFFMQRAAEVGQGSFTYIGALEDIQKSMVDLFFKIERPILSDIQVDFNGAQVEVFPNKLPDLYAGEPLLLTAKIDGPMPSFLSVSGQSKYEVFQQQINLLGASEASDIDTLWARQKIHFLSDQMRSQNQDFALETKKEITQLALNHQLMSKFTSFVAVEETPSRLLHEVLSKKIAPNAMPHGNTMTFPIASTALGLNQLWLYALVTLVMLLLLHNHCLRNIFRDGFDFPKQTANSNT